ncbi:hypothetical protein NFI96_004011, partial [Prochilodus magdalenae]
MVVLGQSAHEAGLVALRVMKDLDSVSSSVLFEYRARNAASLPSSQLDWLSLDAMMEEDACVCVCVCCVLCVC